MIDNSTDERLHPLIHEQLTQVHYSSNTAKTVTEINEELQNDYHGLANSSCRGNRRKWTAGDIEELKECYVLVDPKKRGWGKRLADKWKERGNQEKSEKYLSNHVRWLLKQNEDSIQPEGIHQYPQLCNDQIEIITIAPGKNNSPIATDEQSPEENSEFYQKVMTEMKNPTILTDPVIPLKTIRYNILIPRIAEANELVKNVPCENLLDLLKAYKSIAKVISQELSPRKMKPPSNGLKPWWLSRIERNMQTLFKDIDRLQKYHRLNQHKKDRLIIKYRIENHDVNWAIETCRQKLWALKAKRKRYLENEQRRKENQEFSFNRKRLFDRMLKRSSENNVKPEYTETERFWRSIWTPQNPTTTQEYSFEMMTASKQEECFITLQDLRKQLKKTANWKAPGLDGLHGFWVKHLQCFHLRLVSMFNSCIRDGVPDFLTTGRTVLIQKDSSKGNAASNYRPITCLSILWKTLTLFQPLRLV
jgi:hypothetical protein